MKKIFIILFILLLSIPSYSGNWHKSSNRQHKKEQRHNYNPKKRHKNYGKFKRVIKLNWRDKYYKGYCPNKKKK
jgi:hypothetical protein